MSNLFIITTKNILHKKHHRAVYAFIKKKYPHSIIYIFLRPYMNPDHCDEIREIDEW